MNSNYRITYNVDLVLCIDATGSMIDIMNKVKENASRLHTDIMNRMKVKKKPIGQIRVRLIAFRDYRTDGSAAMFATDFFKLSEQTIEFKDQTMAFRSALNSIEPDGGGDIPEDGLEALAYAIRSQWDTSSVKRRHIISVWTDAPTHPIGYARNTAGYPQSLPKSFEELTRWWGDKQHKGYMDSRAKRLVIYAPLTEENEKDENYWTKIAKEWDNAMISAVVPGKGLEECDYNEILDKICSTI